MSRHTKRWAAFRVRGTGLGIIPRYPGPRQATTKEKQIGPTPSRSSSCHQTVEYVDRQRAVDEVPQDHPVDPIRVGRLFV